MTTPALSNPAPAIPGRAGVPLAPGDLMRLTREFLPAEGIPDRPDSDQLLIAPAARPRSEEKARETRAARCAPTVDGNAGTRRCFFPWARDTTDGHWLAAALLTGTAGTGPCHPGTIGVKGTAGMDLRRRGLPAGLNVCEDGHSLDAASRIAVTAPGPRGPEPAAKGTAPVSADETVCWERCYWHEHAVSERGAEQRSVLPGSSAVARAVAETVTAAVRTAWPELDAG